MALVEREGHLPFAGPPMGRKASRAGVRGCISGRANVGFIESDWRFLASAADAMNCTISEIIRDAVHLHRVRCEKAGMVTVVAGDAQRPEPDLPGLSSRFA